MGQQSRWLLNTRWPHTPVTVPRKQRPSSGVCICKLPGAFGMQRGLRLGGLPVLKVKGYPPITAVAELSSGSWLYWKIGRCLFCTFMCMDSVV